MIEIQGNCVREAKGGCPTALGEIMVAFDESLGRMAASKARRYSVDVDDLRQVGSIALWKAVGNWQGDRPFVPYAIKYMDGAMKTEIRGSTNQHELGRFASLDSPVSEDGATLIDFLADDLCRQSADVAVGREEDIAAERHDRARLCGLTPRAKGLLLNLELGGTPTRILRSQGIWARNAQGRLLAYATKRASREPVLRQASYPYVWTIPRLLVIARCAKQRGGYKKAASELGTTVTAVRSAAAKSGIRESRHLRERDYATLKEMADLGRTPGEIAKRLGCSAETVRVKVRRLGYPPEYCKARWQASSRRKEMCRTLASRRKRKPGSARADATDIESVARPAHGSDGWQGDCRL